jgi:putative flavoprotein involved in K+ transport
MRLRTRPSQPCLDVLVIGAGPAGLGCAIALKECGVESLLVLDRAGVGAAFERWPSQMRMITPSFHSNPYDQPDLNAITPHTSPADYLNTEHPSGPDYARYLRALVAHHEIPVRIGPDVRSLQRKGREFIVDTSEGPMRARFVIWAAGEFFHPHDGGIAGAGNCLHNSEVSDWKALPGVEHAIVGGFESGIDAAIHLAWAGKTVHVLSRGEPWHRDSSDPSRTLTPHTRDRLKTALLDAPGTIRLYKNADIAEVVRLGDRHILLDREGDPIEISTPPILCTGFRGALKCVEKHFLNAGGIPSFTEEADESPRTPGLFYSGPALRHRGTLFCFIYKFRGRFGVVAREIAMRLNLPWKDALHHWERRGFMIDDLACCTDCTCAVSQVEDSSPPPIVDYQDRASLPGPVTNFPTR